MAVIGRVNPDMRQGQEEIVQEFVQQSVHVATRIKQNLRRAAQLTFKNIGATFAMLE
jgi:hypothetical protein